MPLVPLPSQVQLDPVATSGLQFGDMPDQPQATKLQTTLTPLPANMELDQPSNAELAANFAARANETGAPKDIQMALQAENEAKAPSFMPSSARFERGVTDPYRAIGQLGAHVLPGIDANAYDAKLSSGEADYQAQRAAAGLTGSDTARGVGNFFGSLPLNAMIPAGESLLGATGYGLLNGGISGATQPVYDTSKGFWKPKAGQTAMGAGIGGATGAATSMLSRAIDPQPGEDLNHLLDRGVTPTIGQNIGPGAAKAEDIMGSFNPLVAHGQRTATESFNRAAYNEVLGPIGATYDGPVGRDGIRAVGDALSDAYENLTPNLRLVPDQEFHVDLANANALTSRMSESSARQYESILTQDLPRGNLTGQGVRDLQSKLSQEIRRFGASNDPSHQMIAEGLEGVRDAVNGALERTNPQYAEELTAINRGWRNLVPLERAGVNAREGVFTPAQLMSAVRQADDSVRKRAIARGTAGPMFDLADAGVNVLGNRYPDSGTPGRMVGTALATGGLGAAAMTHPVAAGAVAATSGLYLSPVQRAISNLFSQRTGQVAPLLGGAVRGSAPLLQAGARQAIPSLLGY